jgi:hypothetical protein
MPPPRWFAVGSADGVEPDADARAANKALVHDDAKLLVVFCSPSYDLPELLARIRACSAGVPVIGCTTSGEIATSGPGEAGVVVAAFGGDGFEIGTAAAMGARRNNDHVLTERPALDVYLKYLGLGEPPTAESFPRLALTHPFGLGRPSGEEQVRFIGGADFAERSLSCIAQVPQGGLVWIMEGDADSVLAATDAACRDSLAALDGRPPLGVLAFDCIARRGVLGDQGIHTEIKRLTAIAGQAPVAGLYVRRNRADAGDARFPQLDAGRLVD